MLSSLSSDSKRVFSFIQGQGPISKSELRALAKIKISTLNRIIEHLVEHQIIQNVGDGNSTGGRKPTLYDISPERYLVVGIDLSRTYLQVILADLKLRLVDQRQTAMSEAMTPEKALTTIDAMVREMTSNLPNRQFRIIGAGIGAPAPISRKDGMILNPGLFAAPGWVDVPIRSLVHDLLRIPAVIEVGTNAALFAEYLLGSGKGRRSIAFINCGVGIRSSFISEGMIMRTLNDIEDAFGHMIVNADGLKCDCSNYGCIDCYSSIGAILRNFQNAYKTGRATSIEKPLELIDHKDICIAAENGDLLSREILTSAAVIIGTGLSNFIKLLNPDLVIISGPLAKNSRIFYETVISVAAQKCRGLHEAPNKFERIGALQDSAIALGASALCLDRLLEGK